MKDLSVRFGDKEVLSDINLHIHCGTLAAVIGRNGAGKSTLVRAILGEIPHSGSIEFKDKTDGRIKKLVTGYVPQTIDIEKNTPMDVYDLIASFHYKTPVLFKKRRIREEISQALSEFEALPLIDRPVGRLSGGQLQRVMLAMAVMNEPNLLVLDEPVSGIDKSGMDLFYGKMRELTEHHDLAIVLISHDLDYVAKYADQVILLDKEVLADGTPRQVFESEQFLGMFGGASYRFGTPKIRGIYPGTKKGGGEHGI